MLEEVAVRGGVSPQLGVVEVVVVEVVELQGITELMERTV